MQADPGEPACPAISTLRSSEHYLAMLLENSMERSVDELGKTL
ncbi:hypothetical protein V6C53_06785 [Desulfocurvibacter africanus]|nr:hypothetical protein [Desulfocurvibacter africanus]